MDAESSKGPLDGILVADLSRVLAGPYCTMLLADLGATVIKVEGPNGDDTRRWMPPDLNGEATYYLSINRNKRSIILDFGDPADLALARELVDRADIAVQNFKVGGLERFGLDYESVSKTNPSLVYLSISGFGSDEGARLPGYDLVVQAASGLMSLTGEADGPPFRAGLSAVDVICGLHGTVGVLAALSHRQATGEGQHVEVNLMSSILSGMVNHTGGFASAGAVPFRMGNSHPGLYPYEPMPTADKDVIIAIGNDGQFRRLCQVLDVEQLADDERFATNSARTQNRGDLRPVLVEALSRWASEDLFLALADAGVPCGPINTIDAGVALADQLGLDPVVEIEGPGRTIGSIRNPIRFAKTPAQYDLCPPNQGEHSDQIRRWLAAPDATLET